MKVYVLVRISNEIDEDTVLAVFSGNKKALREGLKYFSVDFENQEKDVRNLIKEGECKGMYGVIFKLQEFELKNYLQ